MEPTTRPGGAEGGGQAGPERFDQLLADLKTIVEKLERADLPLEDALLAFEKGVELSRRGQAILDAAERRVETLLKDGRTEALEPARREPGMGETR